MRQVSGVDIDPQAVQFARQLEGFQCAETNFMTADFFTVTPDHLRGERFSVILGNPPYTRHHGLTGDQVLAARMALDREDRRLPKTSAYWAYFVVHSLAFLARDGRLALILPSALITSSYGRNVRDILKAVFREVRIFIFRERLFSDAESESVVVLASDFDHANEYAEVSSGDGVEALREFAQHPGQGASINLASDGSQWKRALLPSDATRVLARLETQSLVKKLDELATIRIGVVTGSNRFFVLTPEEAKEARISGRHFVPTITSGTQIRWLSLTSVAWRRLKSSGRKSLLLVPPAGRVAGVVRSYLRSPMGKAAKAASHCTRRKVWFRFTELRRPAAFLTYISEWAPRLMLNPKRVLCTNAVHRVWWRGKVEEEAGLSIALGVLTSATGLSAEIVGRSYGGGALKLELGEARRLLIPVPKIPRGRLQDAAKNICRLMGDGKWRDARELADGVVLREGLGLSEAEVRALRNAQDALRRLRLGVRPGKAREGGEAGRGEVFDRVGAEVVRA